MGLFHCEPESLPHDDSLWWDVELRPNYREFFLAAKMSGVRLMYFFEQVFDDEMIERVEDSLEISVIADEERRSLTRRLAEFRGYLGFLCRVGVGFSQDRRMHWYDVYSEWYMDYLDLLEDIRVLDGSLAMGLDEDEEDDEDDDTGGKPPLGGYYSNN